VPFVDTTSLILTVGYLGIAAIIFAESGLLFGFLLPGDTLLLTAGLLASQGELQIGLLVLHCFVAAVTGDAVGYVIGRRFGRRLFEREDSLLFRRRRLIQAEQFFERHGGTAVVLARFVPVVRTLTPVVAGMGAMSYPRFAAFNAVGALTWTVGVTLAGYFLGSTVPGIDRYLLPTLLLLAVVTVLVGAVHLWRTHRVVSTPASGIPSRDCPPTPGCPPDRFRLPPH
jgi:membrane-associated protein